jgi:hypothetical protein
MISTYPSHPDEHSAVEKDTTRTRRAGNVCTTPHFRTRTSFELEAAAKCPEQQLRGLLGWLFDSALGVSRSLEIEQWPNPMRGRGPHFYPNPSQTSSLVDCMHACMQRRWRWANTSAPPRRMAATPFLTIGDPRQTCSALIPPTGRTELV